MQGNKNNRQKQLQADAYLILRRFKNEALREVKDKDGNVKPLTATQVRAGETYLRKIIPDLRSIEHSGNIDGKLQVTVAKFADINPE